jgi:hypothetical protein
VFERARRSTSWIVVGVLDDDPAGCSRLAQRGGVIGGIEDLPEDVGYIVAI